MPQVEIFYFKGTPAGLPIGSSIESDCDNTDFPASGGVAVAQVISQNGLSAGCYPAADVNGTELYYTAGTGNTVRSVTVMFASHRDRSGNLRQTFMQIKCSPGKTRPYTYTTTGDEGRPSEYVSMNGSNQTLLCT